MDTIQLIGSTMGLGFLAGIRLYATVLALGLAVRFQWIHPAGSWGSLQILGHPAVLAVAALGCVAEFFADKIPWVDSVWDSFHTFIRPIGAAVLAGAVLVPVDPPLRLALILLCGGVALASHSSKATARLAANHSPEPFTNIGMSLIGDVLAPFGVWLSLKHPLIVLTLVLIFLGVFAWFAPKIVRAVRTRVRAVKGFFGGRNGGVSAPANYR